MGTRLLVLLSLSLGALASAMADDGAMQGAGGTLEAMAEHPSVVMERMDVEIEVFPPWPGSEGYGDVDCAFVFRNSGKATKVRMGFPEEGWGNISVDRPQGFVRFATWVDGKPAATRVEGFRASERDSSWKRWRVKAVQFGAGQKREVRVRYRGRLGEDSLGGTFFVYRVGSGGSWKGPIGQARVRVRLHADPGLGKFALNDERGRFRACGPNCYEWRVENLEATAHDDASVYFRPGYEAVTMAKLPVDVGDWGCKRAVVWRQALWMPTSLLAKVLNAELSEKEGIETIVLGGHRVAVQAGSPWVETEAGTVGLAEAPRRSGGCTWVTAPVMRALGAEVEYDPKTRGITMTYALWAAVGAGLGARYRQVPKGWAPLERDLFEAEAVRWVREQGSPEPWLCVGDFDGDGAKDAAVMLRKGLGFGLAVLYGRAKKGRSFEWVTQGEAEEEPGPRTMTVLRKQPAGVIAYWREGETTPKSGRLALDTDGIEVVYYGKAAIMYYWDALTGKYLKVQTAD
jgi:hypothetical protein